MKYCRIKKEKDYKKIFAKGKRAYSPSLTVIYRKAEKNGMGICIGKKYGKAVVRNRIKRLIRAAFYPEAEKLNFYNVLIIPKIAEEYSFEVFSKDMKSIFRREKLYKD